MTRFSRSSSFPAFAALILFGGAFFVSLSGCGGSGGTAPGATPASGPTPTPTPARTPGPTPPPTISRYHPAVTGTRGDIPLQWGAKIGFPVLVLVSPGAVANDAFPLLSFIAAPQTYGDREFDSWHIGDKNTRPTAQIMLEETGAASQVLRAAYRPRTATADGFQPSYWKTSFHRWNHFPVKIHINRDLISNLYEDRLRVGLDKWGKATGGALSYTITENSAEADIEIVTGDVPAGTIGFCKASWDEAGFLTNAQITLAPTLLGQDGLNNQLETIIAHEFGHALGIIGTEANAGHSLDSEDIMYRAPSPSLSVISERDMNTITTIYPDRLSLAGRRLPLLTPQRPGPGTAIID